jgi:hypothetical protein
MGPILTRGRPQIFGLSGRFARSFILSYRSDLEDQMKGMVDRFTIAIVGVVVFMLLAESGVAQTYTVLYRFAAGCRER